MTKAYTTEQLADLLDEKLAAAGMTHVELLMMVMSEDPLTKALILMDEELMHMVLLFLSMAGELIAYDDGKFQVAIHAN